MYWPKEGVETHGVIQVKLVNEDARATYTIRTFSIKHLKVLKLFQGLLQDLTFMCSKLVEEEKISERRASCYPIPLHKLARPRYS